MLTLASASGNVFAFLPEADAPPGFDGATWARALCPRGTGLGLDGLFLVSPFVPGQTWTLEHWEPDGSRTFCSNGTRAAAALLPPEAQGLLDVRSTDVAVQLHRTGTTIGLRLGEGPDFGLRLCPPLDPRPHAFGWTGTPHLVVEVADVSALDMGTEGPRLRHHPELADGANVTFMQRLPDGTVAIRTWERGVEGETLCCGQGACVAAAWMAQRGHGHTTHFKPLGPDPVTVRLEALKDGLWQNLWLEGRVRTLGQVTLGPGLDLP